MKNFKTFAVRIWQRTRGEWEDSTELWSTSYVAAKNEKDAIRRVNLPKGYDIGSSSISFFAEAFEAHI